MIKINDYNNVVQKYDTDDYVSPITYVNSYNKKLDAHTISKQVEGIFIQMLLKSMRKTLPKEGLFDNSQTRLYTEFYDQNISQILSQKGIGLSQIIEKQIRNINKISDK